MKIRQKAESFGIVAGVVFRNPELQRSRRSLQHLRRTIRYREKAQRWFEHLYPKDARHRRAEGHREFNEHLRGVYQTLSGGRTYSLMRHRECAKGPGVGAEGSMLEQQSIGPFTMDSKTP